MYFFSVNRNKKVCLFVYCCLIMFVVCVFYCIHGYVCWYITCLLCVYFITFVVVHIVLCMCVYTCAVHLRTYFGVHVLYICRFCTYMYILFNCVYMCVKYTRCAHACMYILLYTVRPLYYKPLKCGNLYNKNTILCPSLVL